MSSDGYRETNHLAIAGFLLPFAAAAVTGLLILIGGDDFKSSKLVIIYIIIVLLILLAGMTCSIKSIPLIEKKGDKDYAYSGLVLNILFLLIYLVSLIYLILNILF